MWGSYVCRFNLMKNGYHEKDLVLVPFVSRGRNRQEKTQLFPVVFSLST